MIFFNGEFNEFNELLAQVNYKQITRIADAGK